MEGLRCPVSQAPYSAEAPNRPVSLKCGHTLSEASLSAILAQGTTSHACPVCQQRLHARDRHAYTVNYALLDIIQALSSSPATLHAISQAAAPATEQRQSTETVPSCPLAQPHRALGQDQPCTAGSGCSTQTSVATATPAAPQASQTTESLTAESLLRSNAAGSPVSEAVWQQLLQHFRLPEATLAGLQQPSAHNAANWQPDGIDGVGRPVYYGYRSDHKRMVAAVQMHTRAAAAELLALHQRVEFKAYIMPLLGILTGAIPALPPLQPPACYLLYWAEGRSLRTCIGGDPMTQEDAVTLLFHLVVFIRGLHQHGVPSHAVGPISPDTLFCRGPLTNTNAHRNKWLLAPFMDSAAVNMAKACSSNAPEARNQSHYSDGARSRRQRLKEDVWRVAATAVYAMSGYSRFQSASVQDAAARSTPGLWGPLSGQELKQRVRSLQLTRSTRLPQRLEAALKVCFETEPEHRPHPATLLAVLPPHGELPQVEPSTALNGGPRRPQGTPASAPAVQARRGGREEARQCYPRRSNVPWCCLGLIAAVMAVYLTIGLTYRN